MVGFGRTHRANSVHRPVANEMTLHLDRPDKREVGSPNLARPTLEVSASLGFTVSGALPS